MIKILVDGASDYTIKETKEKGISLVPLNVAFGEGIYEEGETVSRDQFYELLKTHPLLPKTSQPSPNQFVEVFEEVKKNGDELICFLLTPALSGTYQSASIAKDIVEYDGIHLVDTGTVTICIKVLADYALKLIAQGKSVSEIITAVEQVKSKVKVYAMLDTLEYLAKGGRLPKAAAVIGNMAKLKPVITILESGEVGIIGKSIGKAKGLNLMINLLSQKEINHDFPMYSIYSYGEELVSKFEAKLQENYEINGRHQLGAVIGTHVGPGACGVVFVEK